MANIEFIGFVQEVKNDKKATITENHRKKDQEGNYQTVSKTFRTVKPGYNSNITFSHLTKGDMVKVTGREITEEWEYEGKKYKDLVVQADLVEVTKPNNNPEPQRVQKTTDIALDLESPF